MAFLEITYKGHTDLELLNLDKVLRIARMGTGTLIVTVSEGRLSEHEVIESLDDIKDRMRRIGIKVLDADVSRRSKPVSIKP